MKEPVDHILRPPLPWRVGEPGMTECGYDASKVKTLTREAFDKRVQEMGSQRTALFTCMTCTDANRRWRTRDDDLRSLLGREIDWEWGSGFRRDDRGTRLRDELVAIAVLIEKHRDEFDALVEEHARRQEWLNLKAGRGKSLKPRGL